MGHAEACRFLCVHLGVTGDLWAVDLGSQALNPKLMCLQFHGSGVHRDLANHSIHMRKHQGSGSQDTTGALIVRIGFWGNYYTTLIQRSP